MQGIGSVSYGMGRDVHQAKVGRGGGGVSGLKRLQSDIMGGLQHHNSLAARHTSQTLPARLSALMSFAAFQLVQLPVTPWWCSVASASGI